MSDTAARRRVPWHALGLILAVCVLAGAVVWVSVRALMLKSEVDAIEALTSQLSTAVADRDLDGLAGVNNQLAEHTAHAVALSSDPLWTTAEWMPLVGPNLAAVRVAVEASDTLSTQVVAPILRTAAALPDADGAALATAVAAGGPLDRAAAALHGAAHRLTAISTDDLLYPVASGVTQLTDVVSAADTILGPLASSAQVLPALLGTDSAQTILVMVQNPAELRTGGGITGTFVQLRAADGKLTMQKMLDSTAFGYRRSPILPVSKELTTLYGDVVGRFVQDASIPADFSTTSALASAWWTGQGGARPDAVVSIDPLVLQSLLRVTGSVNLADGSELSADNLVQRVLVDSYMTMTPEQQSVFFAQATAAVFTRLFDAGLSPVQWAQALAQPIQDGRVSVWSADPATQKAVQTGPLGGPAVRQDLAGDNAYAVYFNDNTGGKMATYMKTAITTAQGSCRADGKHTVEVAVSLTSTTPKDASAFPTSMTGGGIWGVGIGDIGMNVTVAAPAGAFFEGVRIDGTLASSANVSAEGHPTSIAHVNLQPGETNVLAFRFVVGDEHDDVHIVHTPMLTDPTVATGTLRCG